MMIPGRQLRFIFSVGQNFEGCISVVKQIAEAKHPVYIVDLEHASEIEISFQDHWIDCSRRLIKIASVHLWTSHSKIIESYIYKNDDSLLYPPKVIIFRHFNHSLFSLFFRDSNIAYMIQYVLNCARMFES